MCVTKRLIRLLSSTFAVFSVLIVERQPNVELLRITVMDGFGTSEGVVSEQIVPFQKRLN